MAQHSNCNQGGNLILVLLLFVPGFISEQAAEEEVGLLKTENVELQRRVCALQRKRRSVNVEQFILEGQDAYYRAVSFQA